MGDILVTVAQCARKYNYVHSQYGRTLFVDIRYTPDGSGFWVAWPLQPFAAAKIC